MLKIFHKVWNSVKHTVFYEGHSNIPTRSNVEFLMLNIRVLKLNVIGENAHWVSIACNPDFQQKKKLTKNSSFFPSRSDLPSSHQVLKLNWFLPAESGFDWIHKGFINSIIVSPPTRLNFNRVSELNALRHFSMKGFQKIVTQEKLFRLVDCDANRHQKGSTVHINVYQWRTDLLYLIAQILNVGTWKTQV